MTCRNIELIAVQEHKQNTYPRSCPTCKFGPCRNGITVPAGDMEKFGYPVEPEKPTDKYAVIITDTYSQAGYDPGEPNETVKYDTIQYFDSLTALSDWYMDNQARKYDAKIVKQVIKYTPLKVTTEVKIHVA